MRFIDRLKSLIYRLLRSNAPSDMNKCTACKKRKKNYWNEFALKQDCLIGYDNMLCEWVIFKEDNIHTKIWAIGGYIKNVQGLNEPLWNDIRLLCTKCITKYFWYRDVKKDVR